MKILRFKEKLDSMICLNRFSTISQSRTPLRTIVALPVLTVRAHSLPRISHKAHSVSGAAMAANDPHIDDVAE
jgi:hypothetical protein